MNGVHEWGQVLFIMNGVKSCLLLVSIGHLAGAIILCGRTSAAPTAEAPGWIPGIFGEKSRRIQPAIRAKKNPRGSLRRHFSFITGIIYILRGNVKHFIVGKVLPASSPRQSLDDIDILARGDAAGGAGGQADDFRHFHNGPGARRLGG